MSEPAPTLADLLAALGENPSPAAARRAVREVRERGLAPADRPPVRVAILASSNFDLLPNFFEIELWRAGLAGEFHVGHYGQFRQELLGPSPELVAFRPDF